MVLEEVQKVHNLNNSISSASTSDAEFLDVIVEETEVYKVVARNLDDTDDFSRDELLNFMLLYRDMETQASVNISLCEQAVILGTVVQSKILESRQKSHNMNHPFVNNRPEF